MKVKKRSEINRKKKMFCEQTVPLTRELKGKFCFLENDRPSLSYVFRSAYDQLKKLLSEPSLHFRLL